MLRLSKLTDYAVVVLVRLGRDQAAGLVQTSPGIAQATGVPEPTVAKVLKAMAAAGLVLSQRGAHGGYRLARPLAAIPVSDVIEAVDGRIALTACVEGGEGRCEAEALCPVRGRWDPVNDAIRDALASISVEAMRPRLPQGGPPQGGPSPGGPPPRPSHLPPRPRPGRRHSDPDPMSGPVSPAE